LLDGESHSERKGDARELREGVACEKGHCQDCRRRTSRALGDSQACKKEGEIETIYFIHCENREVAVRWAVIELEVVACKRVADVGRAESLHISKTARPESSVARNSLCTPYVYVED
jgi:hypothetical protein